MRFGEITSHLICAGIMTLPAFAHAVSLDSVWFSEETNCDGQNLVHICYTLGWDNANIIVRMSADSGATWNVPLITLIGAAGDMGANIAPGTHCFDWLMSADYFGYETYDCLLEITATAIMFVDSFNEFDTTRYQINGNDGYVAPDSEYFVLTQNTIWRNGRLITIDTFYCDTVAVEFDFKFAPGYCDQIGDSTGADGVSLNSANIQFSCDASGCDTVTATVRGFVFTSGDSVIVSLDSLYNEQGCITIP